MEGRRGRSGIKTKITSPYRGREHGGGQKCTFHIYEVSMPSATLPQISEAAEKVPVVIPVSGRDSHWPDPAGW